MSPESQHEAAGGSNTEDEEDDPLRMDQSFSGRQSVKITDFFCPDVDKLTNSGEDETTGWLRTTEKREEVSSQRETG